MTSDPGSLPDGVTRDPCESCGSTAAPIDHRVREMMFGTHEEFRLRECRSCGRLKLVDVPSDLSAHYPADYYSLRAPDAPEASGWPRRIRRARAELVLRLPERAVERLLARGLVPGIFAWTSGLGLRTDSSIADIGSGSGHMLQSFHRNGFGNLQGFDPYLAQAERTFPGMRLARASLGDISGPFGLVMLHHVFEHMPDPRGAMGALARLVDPDGALLIRTPVADSWAWQQYGVNWIQLDPPRHLYIHTERSIVGLAQSAGLRLYRSFRDGTAFQMWGSELAARGLALREHGSSLTRVFDRETLAQFERRAHELNAAGTGDSACFIFVAR